MLSPVTSISSLNDDKVIIAGDVEGDKVEGIFIGPGVGEEVITAVGRGVGRELGEWVGRELGEWVDRFGAGVGTL